MDDPWGLSAWLLYTEISPNTDMAAVSAHIRLAKYNNCKPESRNYHPEVALLPMNNWYLRSEFKNGVNTGGRIQYVWALHLAQISLTPRLLNRSLMISRCS